MAAYAPAFAVAICIAGLAVWLIVVTMASFVAVPAVIVTIPIIVAAAFIAIMTGAFVILAAAISFVHIHARHPFICLDGALTL